MILLEVLDLSELSGEELKKKNGSGELGLRFIAERASAPLKDSLEAAGLCRRNPSVRVTGEPTKREQTRLLGLALTGGCVWKNPPDLQAGVQYVVVDFPVLSWQRRQDNWEQKRQFYPQQHVEKKRPEMVRGGGLSRYLHVL